MTKRKKVYGNRKRRKKLKMAARSWLAFWDKTNSPYQGIEREIFQTLCKSSSIETFRKYDEKIERITSWT